MQTIATHVQDKSLALAVWAQNAVTEVVDATRRRMREERGQTAIEYAGILALVGLLFVAIFALNLDDKVKSWGQKVIDAIDNGSGSGGGGGKKP
jgi:Flp pilus assembly pilin Flp